MGETFYAVQQLIDGRAGCQPSSFSTLEDARTYVNELKAFAAKYGPSLKVEYHIYEVREIKF